MILAVHYYGRLTGCSGARSRLSSDKTRDTDDVTTPKYRQHNHSVDLSHSHTASSITSHVTDKSMPRYPAVGGGGAWENARNLHSALPFTGLEQPRTMYSYAAPQRSPLPGHTAVTLVAPSAFRPVDAGAAHYSAYNQHSLGPPVVNTVCASPVPFTDMLCANVTMATTQTAQYSLTPSGYLSASAMGNNTIAADPSLSPYPRGYPGQTYQSGSNFSNSPSFISTGSNTMPHISSSPCVLNQFNHHSSSLSPNQNVAAVTGGYNNQLSLNHPNTAMVPAQQLDGGHAGIPSFRRDVTAPTADAAQQNNLLHEITRLNDRLQYLEKENTVMSEKLSKQQWEVASRLSEIEMHVCVSDNSEGRESSLIDDKSLQGNRESII